VSHGKDSLSAWSVLLLAFVGVACGDVGLTEHTPVTEPPAAAASVDRPGRTESPWSSMSDEEYSAELERANGRVIIGFKSPEQARGVDATGRVIVPASSVLAGKEVLRLHQVEPAYEFQTLPAVVAELPPKVALALRKHPRIDYVEPSVPGTWFSEVTPWGVSRVRAPQSWSYSAGAGAKLLILDSGVDSSHRDLTVQVAWRCISGPVADQRGHGTFVAGVAGARDNTVDVIGVGHGVDLWSANIEVAGAPDPAEAACSVDVARVNGVDVVNMSWGTLPFTALTDAINGGYNYDDMIFVAAVGNNSGPVSYPATLSSVVAVTATDQSDGIANFANYGSTVELAAPGVDILSTSMAPGGGQTATLSGTSFAAPHVSAAAALLRSEFPTWSNSAIRARLQTTATDLGPVGVDQTFGFGLLNIETAIRMSVDISGPPAVYAGTTRTWTASVQAGQSPYAYQWFKNGSLVGTGPSVTLAAGFSDFLLRLHVTDADGSSGTAELEVVMLYCTPPQIQC